MSNEKRILGPLAVCDIVRAIVERAEELGVTVAIAVMNTKLVPIHFSAMPGIEDQRDIKSKVDMLARMAATPGDAVFGVRLLDADSNLLGTVGVYGGLPDDVELELAQHGANALMALD